MNKVYVVHWDYDGLSDLYVYSSLEKAKAKFRKLIGEYILDCINQGDRETATKFVSELHAVATDDYEAYATNMDDIYITKESIDED